MSRGGHVRHILVEVRAFCFGAAYLPYFSLAEIISEADWSLKGFPLLSCVTIPLLQFSYSVLNF